MRIYYAVTLPAGIDVTYTPRLLAFFDSLIKQGGYTLSFNAAGDRVIYTQNLRLAEAYEAWAEGEIEAIMDAAGFHGPTSVADALAIAAKYGTRGHAVQEGLMLAEANRLLTA